MKKTVPFHANGHWLTRDRADTVEVLALEIGEETHVYLDRSDMSYSCALCGEFIETRDTAEAVYIDTPCPAAEGLTTVTRLEVPSGKLIVSDDLRPVFDGFDHDGFASYNSVLGQQQVIEAFAEQGCAFGPVGNSCPTLWQTGEDTYVVARKPWAEGLDDPWAYEDDVLAPEGARKLASVCTDLWAYSIADLEHWLSKGGTLVPKYDKKTGETTMQPESWADTIVEVPPGTYEFTFHGGELDFDPDADDVVWADIRKVA